MSDDFDNLDFEFGSMDFDGGFNESANSMDNNITNNQYNMNNMPDTSNNIMDGGEMNPFAGSFDTNSNADGNDIDPLDQGNSKPTTMYAIILVVVGIIAVIIVFLVASKINKISKEPEKQTVVQTQVQTQQYQQQSIPQQNANVNVDNTIGDSYNIAPNVSVVPSQNQTSQSNNSSNDWIEITSEESVVFNDEYYEMTFTITEIKHLTRLVDTNKNLVVKTRLRGSISGLSGTYELDVPYNKGVKLVVGNNFTVHVQLGTFNSKTVVGEIRY